VTSTRERQQRAAARARLAREMAERQEVAKRRRQRHAMLGAGGAVVVVVAAVVWAVTALGGDEPEPEVPPIAADTPAPTPAGDPPASPDECAWMDSPGEMVVDVGTPPPDEPRAGTQVMTVSTNLGDIEVTMDLAATPCIAASFSHLASHEFYDGSKCHRMFPGILQCGDPNARGEGYRDTDGTGGPGYRYHDENLPVDADPPYPAGVVAMANSGPDTNGSQFFFIYEDLHLPPFYAIVGTITSGMDVLQQVGDAGHDGAFEPQPGGGHPNLEVIIESLRVGDPA
jgi:peptidyl-prolyl cis-trans isomerase B (cyclophilin B)